MAVMTRPNQSAFVIDADKVKDFIKSQEKPADGCYDVIRQQAAKIEAQLASKGAASCEKN